MALSEVKQWQESRAIDHPEKQHTQSLGLWIERAFKRVFIVVFF